MSGASVGLNGFRGLFDAALRSADQRRATELVRQALGRGVSREELVESMIVASLDSLGKGWDEGTVSLTQLYMAGRIAEQVVSQVLTPAEPVAPWARVLIGTLSDSHGLGQRVVSYYLSAAGVHAVSLGIGVPPSGFVRRASHERFDAVAISVLMYRSALLVQEVRDLLDREGLFVPILVGGAPFNMDRTLWQQVGARAMGSNPAEGVATVRRWVGLAP